MRDIPKPFLDHLEELKTRAMYCVAVVALGSIIGYLYYGQILDFLLKPLKSPLYYSSPAGGFDLMFKVCFFTGVLIAVPVIIYHIFRFLSPVLPAHPLRTIALYLVASCVLLAIGVGFAYLVCLPAALNFFATFGSDQLHSLISTQDYFSFVLRYLVGFGLIFQLPLVLLLLHSAFRFPVAPLLRAGRIVIVLSFIVAAILTPTPDIVNQAMMAGPIILLYYGSVLLIWWRNRRSVHSMPDNALAEQMHG